jgi:hypothetical protein
MTIEGVPEGWELVGIRRPKYNEFHLDSLGRVVCCGIENNSWTYPIIRKIEKPKRYRPFANAEEFKPFRDRWVRIVSPSGCEIELDDIDVGAVMRIDGYNDDSVCTWVGWCVYQNAFAVCEFEDGTPFGIEVTE